MSSKNQNPQLEVREEENAGINDPETDDHVFFRLGVNTLTPRRRDLIRRIINMRKTAYLTINLKACQGYRKICHLRFKTRHFL